MAGKSVAKKGDVKAEAGDGDPKEADLGGDWTPGKVSESAYPNLKTDGAEVTYRATCTFSYSGKQTVGNSTKPVITTSDVTLSANTTLLQNGQSKVLVDGDDNKDDYGNRLYVRVSNKLKTS